MQLKAQVFCLQTQVTYLLTIKAQTESTDSSADQSSQCGSGICNSLFSVALILCICFVCLYRCIED